MKSSTATVVLVSAIASVVIAQILIKWQVMGAGPFPGGARAVVTYFAGLLTKPWVIVAYALLLVSALAWMAVLSQLELSYAYPILSLTYIGVVILSSVFFDEPLTVNKLVGVGLITAGVFAMRSS